MTDTLKSAALLGCTALVAGLGLSTSWLALADTPVQYQGQIGSGQGEIELLRRSPSSKTVKVNTHHIPVQCEDGSTEQTKFGFGWVRVRISHSGRFYKDAVGPDRTGGIGMWMLEGRLSAQRASGRLLYIYDQGSDTPSPGYPFGGGPDCSTDGELKWSATRVP
jgi:hypothetical protein